MQKVLHSNMFYSKESLKLVSNHLLNQCNGVACISIPLQFHFIKGDIIPFRFTTTSLLCLLAFSFCLSCKSSRVYMLPEISTRLLDSTMVCVPFLVQSFSAFSAPNAPIQVCYNSSNKNVPDAHLTSLLQYSTDMN